MSLVNTTFIVVSERSDSIIVEDVSRGMGPGYGPLYLIKATNRDGSDAEIKFVKLAEKEVK